MFKNHVEIRSTDEVAAATTRVSLDMIDRVSCTGRFPSSGAPKQQTRALSGPSISYETARHGGGIARTIQERFKWF